MVNRRYIIGASKGTFKKFERQLMEDDWQAIREGLEVKMCSPPDGGKETYILCRSRDHREKEKAMHERFERRIDDALAKILASCEKRAWKKEVIDRRVGRIMAENSRAAGLYDVTVQEITGRAVISWEKCDVWREWTTLNEGCNLLRTNVSEWSPEDL